jgi:two-component system phosphate regulon response regulator PhoB
MKPRILILSQDANFYLVFNHILKVDGFDTELAGSEEEALKIVSAQSVAAIILSSNAGLAAPPGAIMRLKSASLERSVRTIASLAAGHEPLYLDLLKADVDQIFVMPYAPERLLNYLRTVLGLDDQSSTAQGLAGTTLSVGKLEVFREKHCVLYDGIEIPLQPIQFKLLCAMMMEPGKVFSRDELIGTAWPRNVHVEPRTVDVHISRLREALKRTAGRNLIRTVRSAGYGLDVPPEKTNF